MKYFFLLLLALSLFSCVDEQKPVVVTPPVVTDPVVVVPDANLSGQSLNRPWKESGTSIVIDAYEGNSIDWDKMATDKRVVAVIHRSAQGLKVDTKYKERREIARARGYMWGAYHLGSRESTTAQADLFLSQVKDDDLMILDLEDTTSTKFMTIEQSVVFMEYIFKKTGKIPVVYANHSTVLKLNMAVKDHPLFKSSKLWYARFKENVTDFPKGVWSGYYLWQFSSEINCSTTGACLYNVPGTRSDMDVNVFYGSKEALKAQWTNKP